MSLKDKNEMYCFKRKLTPKLAGTILLTGFSIGIGISGEFFGWNTGLENGWYNMLIAIFISAVMYMGLILSICELCCALPFSSGTGYFAQKSFTVALGALTSATFASHYCLLGASILIALANSISAASLATSYLFLFIICLLTFIVESYPKFFFQLTFCLAAYGFLILLSYVIFTCYVSLTSGVPIEMKNAPSIKMEQMHTYGHTINLKYILKCYPYASWFFIGLEAFPTTAEEVRHIIESAPKACITSFILVFIMSLAVFFAPVMEQGAFIHSIQPLMANFKSMAHLLEPSSITSVLTFTCVLPSLLGGFCVAIYAASRHMYALSRAGILPTPLSLTFHGAPLYSVILALTFALVAVCITEISKALTAPTTLTQRTHDATIKIGTWVASIGYMIVCGSYIYLRVRMANLPRPFTSPFCITGALLSLLISGFFGVVGPVYFDGFFYYILATVFVVVAVLFLPYYWLVALPRLSDAPEKMFVRRQIHRLYGSQKVHRPSMSFDFQTAIDKTKIISILKLDSTKIISQTPPPSSDIV